MRAYEWCATSRQIRLSACATSRRYRAPSRRVRTTSNEIRGVADVMQPGRTRQNLCFVAEEVSDRLGLAAHTLRMSPSARKRVGKQLFSQVTRPRHIVHASESSRASPVADEAAFAVDGLDEAGALQLRQSVPCCSSRNAILPGQGGFARQRIARTHLAGFDAWREAQQQWRDM